MNTLRSLAGAIFVLITEAAGAQVTSFLLPVYTPSYEVTGASGTRWETDLVAVNDGAEVPIGPCAPGFGEDPLHPCPQAFDRFPAGSAVRNPISFTVTTSAHGRVFYVKSDEVHSLYLELTLLRNGTPTAHLPVVQDTEFTTGPMELLDVPVSQLSRTLLRIYGPNNGANEPALVRIYRLPAAGAAAANDLITEQVVALAQEPIGSLAIMPTLPAYAELPITPTLVGTPPGNLVRIEVTALDSKPKWAFATTVRDSAESVVVITPRR